MSQWKIVFATLCRLGLGLGLRHPRVTLGPPKGHPSATQGSPKRRMNKWFCLQQKLKKGRVGVQIAGNRNPKTFTHRGHEGTQRRSGIEKAKSTA
jgi:hypothetical protein